MTLERAEAGVKTQETEERTVEVRRQESTRASRLSVISEVCCSWAPGTIYIPIWYSSTFVERCRCMTPRCFQKVVALLKYESPRIPDIDLDGQMGASQLLCLLVTIKPAGTRRQRPSFSQANSTASCSRPSYTRPMIHIHSQSLIFARLPGAYRHRRVCPLARSLCICGCAKSRAMYNNGVLVGCELVSVDGAQLFRWDGADGCQWGVCPRGALAL
jgi:hypothetical protein